MALSFFEFLKATANASDVTEICAHNVAKFGQKFRLFHFITIFLLF